MPHRYVFPTGERFTCEGCTRCCELTVHVGEDEAARLSGVPNRHGVDPFDRDAEGARTLKRVAGACVFLEEDGRCGVHAKLGYESKPASCRRFPFFTAQAGEQRFVRASFACPTIVAARGAGPDELAAALDRDVPPAALPAEYRVGGAALSPEAYARLEAALAARLASAADLPRALAAFGSLGARLVVASRGGAAAVETLAGELAAPEAFAALAAAARPFRRRDARMLLAPFLLLSAPPEQTRLSRAWHAVKLLANRGRFRTLSHADGVPLAALDAVAWPAECEAPGGLLRRYLGHLLASRAFLVELPVETTLQLVGAAYALVRWNARARAAGEGRREATLADVAAAVQATDREHFAHNVSEGRLLATGWVGQLLGLVFAGPRRLAGLVLEPE